MHAGMYLCIHSFIHACCSYLRSSHFPLGNVLGFGDKTVNGMSQEVEVLPRMSRKYYILVRFEEKYFLNTESFNVVFLPNYLQRSFFSFIIFSLLSGFHKVVFVFSWVIFQYFSLMSQAKYFLISYWMFQNMGIITGNLYMKILL